MKTVEKFGMKPTLNLLFLLVVVGIQTSQGALWQVSVFISTGGASESKDTLLLDVQGTANSLSGISFGNDFREGEIRRIDVNEDFGKINTIRLYQRRNDGIRVRKVVLEDENGRPYTFVCNCWIQNDQPANDSRPSWTLKPLKGPLWQVSVFIDTREYSESNDTLLLEVQGTTNSLSEISLGSVFRQGEIRRTEVDGDFGKINTIRLYQRGKDGIRVRKVVLEDENGRQYTFVCDCWIQTDQPADDSKPSWTLNSLNCYWNDSIPNCAYVVRVSCQNGKCDMCNEGYYPQSDGCRHLGQLSLNIGKEWCLLAYELGFSDSQLDHLRAAFPYNTQQCVASMLVKWYETALKHHINPLPLLIRSLTGVDRYDLVQKINCDFDESDNGSPFNNQKGKLSVFNAEVKKIHFGQTQGDMQMFLDQTQRFLEFQVKDQKFFVNTRAAKVALELLSSKGTLTVMGNPGDGKSTVAVNLLTRLRNEGATILVLSDPALIERIYDDNKQIVYFVDDAFGTPTVNMRLLQTWTRLHDKIESLVKLEKCKLLITTRKHIYMKCQSLLYKCPSYKENLIDLSGEEYRLNMIDKNRIVASYCQNHGLFPTQLSFTKESAYVPGFPLLFKMFANDKRMQELDVYFDQTLSVLYNQLHMLATTDVHAFCGLVLVMMFDGRLPRAVFDQFTPCCDQDRTKIQTIMRVYGIQPCDDGKLETCLDEMIGVYVEEVEEDFRFIHDTIFDTVCLVFGTRYPNEIIRVASSNFIEKRIRTERIPGERYPSLDDVIVLKKSKYHVLASRWIADALRGIIRAMFVNPSIRDADMQAALVDRVRKLAPKASMELLTNSEEQTLSTTQFKETVLFLACKKGFISLVQVLLEKQKMLKADNVKNASNLTIPDSCMMEAVERNHLNVVNALLDHGAMINFGCGSMSYRCLHVACKKGSLDMVKLLMSYGADVNLEDHTGKQAVHYASEFGRLETLKELNNNNASLSAKDRTDRQAIHYAGIAGSLECVQFLQQEGIRLNVPDKTDKNVLHHASTVHCPTLIKYLVSSGLDTNSLDSMGASPLHLACKASFAENIEILLSNGSDPNEVDASMSLPLHFACKCGGPEQDGRNTFRCVQLLLNVVSDVNAVDSFGKTALHYACTWARDRRLDCVTLLLSKGSDPSIMDDDERQPVFYACESGNLKCVQALVNHGIDVNHRGLQGKQPNH